MKILYFYQYFSTPKGSWGTRVYEFASEWVKNGHEVVVVTSVYSKSDLKADKFVENQFFDGINVKVINISINNNQSFFKRVWTFALYALISSFYALTLRADIVIASSGPISVGLPGLVAKFLRGRKLVFETRDLWPSGAIELGIIKNPLLIRLAYWFESQCYANSSLIVSLSKGMTDYIQLKYGHQNVIDVTNAANIDLFSSNAQFDDRGILEPNKYAIYTGNIGEVNNSIWLFEAALELKKMGREDIKILLVGDGKQRVQLEKNAMSLNLSNFIVFDLIPKIDLVGLIQNALVSLVPLKGTPILDTSSPNKFFESLAAGVPIIQNTNGWMKDFLNEYNVGFTLEPNNPKALAEKLVYLDLQKDELNDMKFKAKCVAREQFDKIFLAQKMLNAILKIN